jgi:hypothetical protein
MRRLARLPLLAAATVILAACSGVPNLDAGSAGCSNARGIGPTARDDGGPVISDMAVMPEMHGLSPAEAGAKAMAQGHTVVFNVAGECWCVAPPGGTVSESFWGQHGALWLMVDGFDNDQPGDPPFLGWGC